MNMPVSKAPVTTSAGIRQVFAFFADAWNASVNKKTAWEKFMPMSYEDAERILTRDLPAETRITFALNKNGTGDVTLIAPGVFVEKRPFDLKKHVMTAGYVEVDPHWRSSGIGRNILRNEIEFFQMCGVKAFKINASASAGGYTWARFGFLPEYGGIVRDMIRERYRPFRSLLTNEEKSIVQEALRFRDNAHLWKVADLKIDMSSRIKAVFNSSAQDNKDRIIEAVGEKAVKSYLAEEKALPIGRLLLSGMQWYGYLDFNDSQQMKRAGDYVGGLKPSIGSKMPSK